MSAENDILDHRPSTIAAAAVLAASCNDLVKEALGRSLNGDSCCARLDIVSSCLLFQFVHRLTHLIDYSEFVSVLVILSPSPLFFSVTGCCIFLLWNNAGVGRRQRIKCQCCDNEPSC